jgi:hypothetical protein
MRSSSIHLPQVNTIFLSKGSCAFQEVLERFPFSSALTIVTFNISTSDSWLWEAIGKLPATAVVRIFFNTRKRFDSSRKEQAKIEARKQITAYTSRLDPIRFPANTTVWFCEDNHAKIIMTDDMAYVGSANFSAESNRNWECGVIIRDPSVITELAEAVSALETDSVRFFGSAIKDLLMPLNAVLESLRISGAALSSEYELGMGAHDLLSWDLSEDALDDLVECMEVIRQVVGKCDESTSDDGQPLGWVRSTIQMRIVETIQELAAGSDSLHSLARFNPDRHVSSVIEEDGGPNIDILAEAGVGDAVERRRELVSLAQEDSQHLLKLMRELYAQVRRVISRTATTSPLIDNTD